MVYGSYNYSQLGLNTNLPRGVSLSPTLEGENPNFRLWLAWLYPWPSRQSQYSNTISVVDDHFWLVPGSWIISVGYCSFLAGFFSTQFRFRAPIRGLIWLFCKADFNQPGLAKLVQITPISRWFMVLITIVTGASNKLSYLGGLHKPTIEGWQMVLNPPAPRNVLLFLEITPVRNR